MTGIRKKLFAVCLFVLTWFTNGHGPSYAATTSCYRLLFAGTTVTKDGDQVMHIYQINPDGSDQVRLTDGAVLDSYPLWSPDGKHIAFLRVSLTDPNAQGPQLTIMNPDGTHIQRLVSIPASSPVWSPDSTRLAFIGKRDNKLAVFTIQADGKGLTEILALDGSVGMLSSIQHDIYGEHPLAFSADSRHVHVAWSHQLWTVDLMGHSTTPIEIMGDDPEWSPDDSRVVYVSGQGGGDANIYVMNADGSNVKTLTSTGEDMYPTWSPDGRMIAFTSNSNGNSDNLSDDAYLMSDDGSHLTRLTFDMEDYWNPIWSPDGKQLVVWSNLTQQTYVIDIDSQTNHAVTNVNTKIFPPDTPLDITNAQRFSWSPSLC